MGLVIRQSLKASLSNYVGLVIGYINILILMPKVFSPAQVGISRFVIDISSVLAGFATLGLTYSMSRFFPKFLSKNNSSHNGFTFWIYSIPVVGFVLLGILLAIGGPSILNLLKNGGSNTSEYIHIILPLTFIMLFTIVTEQFCALLGRIVVVNVVRENGLRLLNLILILLAWKSIIDFNHFLLWLLFSYTAVLLVDLIYLFSINKLSFKPDFKFVSENNGMIGVIGVNWISEPSSKMLPYLENINVLSVKALNGSSFVSPTQNNIAEGTYPLARDLFIVNCQGYSGLGMGFASFIAGDVGQRIVLKSGLLPVRVPGRKLNVRNEIENAKE